jgi:8-oxo-dGTP pyrophosphatase MutT (NUDIX family)
LSIGPTFDNQRGAIVKVKDLSITVHLLIEREGKLLLVFNRREPRGKPAGWGLPGGGILPEEIRNITELDLSFDKLAQDALSNIRGLMPKSGVSLADLNSIINARPDSHLMNWLNDQLSLLIFLTAIREGIEETGLLLLPERIVWEGAVSMDHKVVIVKASVVAGRIVPGKAEIDDCDWFERGNLPEQFYLSHRKRLDMIFGEGSYVRQN